jgi:hypothetical protein
LRCLCQVSTGLKIAEWLRRTYEEREGLLELGDLLLGERIGLIAKVSVLVALLLRRHCYPFQMQLRKLMAGSVLRLN